MKKFYSLIFGVIIALGILGCDYDPQVTTIIARENLAMSENSGFTQNGRFFIAAGTIVAEIIKNSDGTYSRQAVIDLQNPAFMFTGLTTKGNTIYTAATFFFSDGQGNMIPVACYLYRIKVASKTPVIQSALLPGHMVIMANGMATDNDGNIFISNTAAPIAQAMGIPEASVIKISITNEANFAISESPWLMSNPIILSPNGLQIKGDVAYLASLEYLFKIKINADGSAATPEVIFQTGNPGNGIDDFAIYDNKIILCEIDNPFDTITTGLSQLRIISINKHNLGQTLYTISLAEYGILPSSVSVATLKNAKLFKPFSLLVTDWLFGGLHQVTMY